MRYSRESSSGSSASKRLPRSSSSSLGASGDRDLLARCSRNPARTAMAQPTPRARARSRRRACRPLARSIGRSSGDAGIDRTSSDDGSCPDVSLGERPKHPHKNQIKGLDLRRVRHEHRPCRPVEPPARDGPHEAQRTRERRRALGAAGDSGVVQATAEGCGERRKVEPFGLDAEVGISHRCSPAARGPAVADHVLILRVLQDRAEGAVDRGGVEALARRAG